MTEHERQALYRYIRWVANEMELRDWTIELLRETCEDGAYAVVYPTFGRKIAEIKLTENFRELAPETQRHTIVHELVHCHLEPAANMVYKDLEDYLGKQTDQIFWNGFKRQIEYGVDAIAAAIAKHLPLIDWAGGHAS